MTTNEGVDKTSSPEKKKQNRRGKGEGSIFQRKDGSWTATINLGSDTNGKRVRKTVYGATKKLVTDKLTRLQNQKLDGTYVDSGKMTVCDLLDRWLEDSAKLNTAPNTHTRYESVVRIHLKPAIGTIKLAQLKPMHVQSMLATMERDGVGERSRGHCYAVLRRALNVGMKWGLLIRNVCEAVDPPKQHRSEVRPLTAEQARTILELSKKTRWHAVFALAITTGLRQGELFALAWDDINLDCGVLSVRHSLEEVSGKLRLKEPKSKSGRRQVTLPAGAIDALWQHKAIQLTEGLATCPMVFCDTEGNLLRKSNFERRVWKKFRDSAEIPKTTTFHDLRHTSATMLLGAGVHPKVVQERLGHSSIQLTMDTYSHVLPSMQQDAATKFDRILEAKSG
jgi:integrase